MKLQMRPARATLRMFDTTELPSLGMVKATLRHPRTGGQSSMDFYVTEREDPILGIDACRSFDMLRVVEENICTTVHDVIIITQSHASRHFHALQ